MEIMAINALNVVKETLQSYRKRKTHATTRMNLEDVMLTEISQSQKDKLCIIPLTWGI